MPTIPSPPPEGMPRTPTSGGRRVELWAIVEWRFSGEKIALTNSRSFTLMADRCDVLEAQETRSVPQGGSTFAVVPARYSDGSWDPDYECIHDRPENW